VPRPEQRVLIREAGRQAIVLLKNQGALLPLKRDQIKTLAVIGENGVRAQVQGGGSIHVRPHYTVSPLAGIRAAAGPETTVTYEVGCLVHRFLPLCETDWLRDEEGRPGLTAYTYDNANLEGAPVRTERVEEMQFAWYGEIDADVDLADFSMRLRGTFTPPRSGEYTFGLRATGIVRLYVDGTLLITSGGAEAPDGDAAEEVTGAVTLEGGEGVPIEITYSAASGSRWRNLRLGCLSPHPDDPLVAAERAAAAADVAIVVAGLTAEWESEGFDRRDMALPRDQDELIRRVAAANEHTIVVLNTGSPVTMPWLDQVPAVLQLWYAGQEAGNALADVLFGDGDPGGRLPTTFPRHLADNPAYLNYPGENGQVLYGEGLFVGYRYYDKKRITPLFPFGFGLSYTTFAYRRLELDKETYRRGDKIEVEVEVENTGARRGSEVIQLYVCDVAARLSRPEKELKQFAKVTLDPGERRVITLTLDEEALAFYDPAVGDWVVEPGRFVLLAGHSAADIRLQQTFRWEESTAPVATTAGSTPARAGVLDTTTPLRLLLENEAARRVLEQHLGELLHHPQANMAMEMTLAQIATIVPDLLPAPKLDAIADDLAQLRG
jgi:beta-glucosidase